MSLKKLSLLMIGFIILTLLSSCASQSATNLATEKIKSKGKLVLGTSADYPPFEFHITKDGKDEIVGIDISIGKEIAKDLGVELEIKDMDFDGLLAALATDNIDVVLASMSATDERKKSVDFSNVYFKAKQKMLVREEDYDKYKTKEDLNGVKIGAQKGSIQEEIATTQLKDSELRTLGKVTDLVLDLKSKNIEAIVLDDAVASAYAKNATGVKVGQVEFEAPTTDGTAVAIKKGNSDLVEKINATIDRLTKEGLIEKFIVENNELADTQQ